MMQAMPTQQRAMNNFEFRFVSVLANHIEKQEDVSDDADIKELDDLGRDGWQIVGMIPDPRLPTAKVLVGLQRAIEAT